MAEGTNGAEKDVEPKVLAQSVVDYPEASDRGVPIPQTSLIMFAGQAADEIMEWGKNPKERDRQLREFITTESVFNAALGIVVARNAAFKWKIEGTDKTVEVSQELLQNADGGRGWQSLIAKVSEDLYTQDTGAFIEIVRDGDSPESAPVGINHLDAMRCWHTGDPRKPVIYMDRNNQFHLLDWWNVIPLSEMPTAIEGMYGLQYCALTRLLLAAQIIKNISIYKKEKSGGRHNRAIHLVSGITSKQIEAAIAQYRQYADSQGLLRYTNPIIVGSPDPNASLQLVTLELASLPDGFSEETTFKHYITQIAMAFGADYQEFAPLPGGNLGTSTQSEILHQKSRGKGPAIFQGMIVQALNFRVLPNNVTFKYEELDLEAEETAAKNARTRAEERKFRIESGEISVEESRQLAADDGDLPQEMLTATAVDITPIVIAMGDAPIEDKDQVSIPELEGERARKASKEEVEYRPSVGAQKCGNCLFFQAPGACQVVEGRIRAIDICNLWVTDTSGVKQEGPRAGPFDDERLKDEARFQRALRRGFRNVQANVVKKLRSESRKELKQITFVPEDTEFWLAQRDEILEALGDLPEELLLEGATQAQRLGLAIDFTLINDEVLNVARTYRTQFIDELSRATRNSLRTAIQTHIESGESLRVLEKRIEPLFGPVRAQAIASTEVTRLYAEGNVIGYKDAGISEVEFRTVRDARVDPDCDELDGQRFPVDRVDIRPPIHTRCRCWLAPVVANQPILQQAA